LVVSILAHHSAVVKVLAVFSGEGHCTKPACPCQAAEAAFIHQFIRNLIHRFVDNRAPDGGTEANKIRRLHAGPTEN
jgi:hypothetical protein